MARAIVFVDGRIAGGYGELKYDGVIFNTARLFFCKYFSNALSSFITPRLSP